MTFRGSIGFGLGLSLTTDVRSVGSNSDIRLAIVGLHGKGKSHIEDFMSHKGERIVALCDVDKNLLEAEKENLRKAGIPVAAYTDFRKLLESPDIDAVVLAVPHHWHVLMTVWACQSGKDVYVEKPAMHNIWEGRQLMAAGSSGFGRYSRIVRKTGTGNLFRGFRFGKADCVRRKRKPVPVLLQCGMQRRIAV